VPGPGWSGVAFGVLRRNLGVRPGVRVVIESWSHALPFARPFVAGARRLGAEPLLVVEDEESFFQGLESGRRPPSVSAPASLARSADAYVYFGGPEAYPRLFGLPPRDLEAILARHGVDWWSSARAGGVRAVRMEIAAATPIAAHRYGVSVDTWQEVLLRAAAVPPDRLRRRAGPLAVALARSRSIRIQHPNGTDLALRGPLGRSRVEDGAPDPLRGSLWATVPAGILAVPVGRGRVDGTWEANRPVHQRFEDPPVGLGPRFRFEGGRLREFAFDRGGEAFARAYGHGGGGRDVPSGLTFGLNPHARGAPELEGIAEGTVGLLLGDNRSIGGRHRSGFAYFTALEGATVEIDGRRWLAGGRWR
jgi:hypothetical protein